MVLARSPAEYVASQEGLGGDKRKRRKKKKRKSESRQMGQPFDSSPEAPTSNDPAAVAKYREDWEAYLRREYGDFYTQYKADHQS